MTNEEYTQIRHSIIQQFRMYKNKELKNFVDDSNIKYNILTKLGLISFDEKEKEEIRVKAKDEWRDGLGIGLNNAIYPEEIKWFTNILKNFDVVAKSEDGVNAIDPIAKRMALQKYYDSLIEFDIEIEDKIKEIEDK